MITLVQLLATIERSERQRAALEQTIAACRSAVAGLSGLTEQDLAARRTWLAARTGAELNAIAAGQWPADLERPEWAR